MTILRSGTTKKYADNWGSAFGVKKKSKSTTKAKAAKKKSTGKKKQIKKK